MIPKQLAAVEHKTVPYNIHYKYIILHLNEFAEVNKALLVDVDQCQKWSPLSSCLWLARDHQLCTQDNHQH